MPLTTQHRKRISNTKNRCWNGMLYVGKLSGVTMPAEDKRRKKVSR